MTIVIFMDVKMHRTQYNSYKTTVLALNNRLTEPVHDNPDALCYTTTVEAIDLLGDESIVRSFPLCCKMGLTEVVRIMIAKGADPTTDEFSAFRFASEQGHSEVLELLLQQISPSDFKEELQECLELATRYKRTHCIKLLSAIVSTVVASVV